MRVTELAPFEGERFFLKPNVILERIADEVAMSSEIGPILVLNSTAEMVAQSLKEGVTISEAARGIITKYDVEYDQAFADVVSMLVQLDDANMLTTGAELRASDRRPFSRRDLIQALLTMPSAIRGASLRTARIKLKETGRECGGLQGGGRRWLDSLGYAITPEPLGRIAPFGPFAQALLESICPARIVWAGSRGMHASMQAATSPEPMRFGRVDAEGTRDASWFNRLDADIIIEVETKLSLLTIPKEWESDRAKMPVARIIAPPGCLAEAYCALGSLLEEKRAFDLAEYVEKINRLFACGKEALQGRAPKRIFYGHGKSGLDTLGEGSVLSCVMDSIGACNAASGLGLESWRNLSLETVRSLNPDMVVLARNRDDVRRTWANWDGCPIQYIPDKPYPWLTGNKLVMQTLGALWLANAVYPDVYDYDMVEMAESCFFALFGYTPDAKELLAVQQARHGRPCRFSVKTEGEESAL